MRLLLIAACLAASSCVLTVAAPSCTDGIENGTESDVDCGGMCGACRDGAHCVVDGDCGSLFCAGSLCVGLPSTSGADTYTIDNGAAIIITPGTQAGYGITANTGGSFRIVWTGDAATSGTYREFQGTVFTSGTMTGFSTGCGGTCNLESDDTVSDPVVVTGGTRIDFDCFTTTGLDGFDFVASAEPVYFFVQVDGASRPDLVFFTHNGQGASAASDPFGLSGQ